MVPICLNFFKVTLVTHPVLQRRNCSLNLFFNLSHELKVFHSTWASSMWQLLHHNLASIVRYIPTKENC